MPIALVAEAFSDEKLPLVQSLNCGDDEFGRVATAWIRCTDPDETALSAMRDRGTQVFLYFDKADNSLVGFGSLGLTQRTVAKDTKRDFSCIPHVGVDHRYHGKPIGVPWDERIAALVMRDLIFRAGQLPPDELLLYVHKDNARARKLYDRLGFVELGNVNKHGNQPMVLRLR